VGLTIDVQSGDPTELTLAGELDAFTAADLRDRLRELMAAGMHDIVIDLAALNFIDSTALGVLVSARKRARHNDADLRLRGIRTPAKQLFDLTGLSRVFNIE